MPQRERLLALALKGLQADRAKIDDEIEQIRNELNGRPAAQESIQVSNISTIMQSKKKRTMSAAARKKISEGMKRRYAELRKTAKR